ncbi:long-chain fatty acid--CoA ligase [candidate division KSB3 bacterium]|uniref:Long-chain-fatty-acid--CoA ligase n=1 Tax=candidate division KSB3 bacterium TaxID=2044937 RepID=A0A2G6KEQ2_9BACT|nr:MAG: long-chain fatty acid--CoA ligase [candidate division KSB3 bacterium]
MTLGKKLEDIVQRFPRKCAIKFQKRKISYRELNESVNKAAHGLVTLGLSKGDRVGILSDNCPEYIITYFAILKIGAIAVPINSFLTGNEVKYIVDNCGIKVLVTSKKFLRTLQPVLGSMESLKRVIVINDPEQTEHMSFDQLLNSGLTENIQADVSNDDLSVFIYTSGTTGHPKGAMLSHNNLITNTEDATEVFNVEPKDKFLLFLPMFHSFTFTTCVLLPLFNGSTIVLIGSIKSMDAIKKAIIFDRVTVFVGVPAVYNVLANKPLPKILKYINAIRAFVSGSAPLPEPVIGSIEEKFRSTLCEGYGLSEASPVVSVNPLFGKRIPGSIGLPLSRVQVKIVDAELNELPVGEIGELAVKGPNVMQGYYNMPEETAKTIVDGWLLTGDIAKLDDEGYIYIVDRKKEMLLVRGVNVYPREIEDVLYQHPHIVECAVIGVPDETKGEVPKAFIVVREGETLSEKEVRAHCKERLAGYKLPKFIEFRPSLPKNATQKIMKRNLR